jgi:hypothetical protein
MKTPYRFCDIGAWVGADGPEREQMFVPTPQFFTVAPRKGELLGRRRRRRRWRWLGVALKTAACPTDALGVDGCTSTEHRF